MDGARRIDGVRVLYLLGLAGWLIGWLVGYAGLGDWPVHYRYELDILVNGIPCPLHVDRIQILRLSCLVRNTREVDCR